jgi:hypothetical protein
MSVYKAINAVQADLVKNGISKGHKNQQQGYSFRGIDDIFNALSPILAAHGLCILPRIISRECTERQTQKGGTLFYVVVEAEFDLVAAEDGSKHTIRTYGEAMDSADKATNKAMSAAYKYAALQAFAIPTEGDNDADSDTPDVAPKHHAPQHQRQPESPSHPKRNPAEATADLLIEELDACNTMPELVAAWKSMAGAIAKLPDDFKAEVTRAKDVRKTFISQRPADDDFPGDRRSAA